MIRAFKKELEENEAVIRNCTKQKRHELLIRGVTIIIKKEILTIPALVELLILYQHCLLKQHSICL